MIDNHGTDHKDESSWSSKFGSEMASYLHSLTMNGDVGDDSGSLPDWGEHWERFGRRVLTNDSRGFVGVDTFATVAEAESWANEWHHDHDEDDW